MGEISGRERKAVFRKSLLLPDQYTEGVCHYSLTERADNTVGGEVSTCSLQTCGPREPRSTVRVRGRQQVEQLMCPDSRDDQGPALLLAAS